MTTCFATTPCLCILFEVLRIVWWCPLHVNTIHMVNDLRCIDRSFTERINVLIDVCLYSECMPSLQIASNLRKPMYCSTSWQAIHHDYDTTVCTIYQQEKEHCVIVVAFTSLF